MLRCPPLVVSPALFDQVEIDEYQNYSKALGALTEAARCLGKAGDQARIEELGHSMENIRQFVEVQVINEIQDKLLTFCWQAVYERNPGQAVEVAREMLVSGERFPMVRRGDVYGFLVEHFAKQAQFKQAYALVEDMKAKIANVNVAYYINLETVRAIEQAVGVEVLPRGQERGQEEEEEDIEDETDRYM